MIIDLILDRKDGEPYNPKRFYSAITGYRKTFPYITDLISLAFDYGMEEDCRRALNYYIDWGGYNPEIKMYVNSVNWLSK